MTRVLTAALLSVIFLKLPAFARDAGPKPDFSGRWELVTEKSDFGKSAKPVGMTLVSENRDGHLHSVETTQTPQGEQETESDWYPDGQRHTYQKPVPGYSITRWDGNALVNERHSDDGQYHETVKLTMQPGGREAIETVNSRTPEGNNRLRLVWRKK
jgi:hypothetical protein